MTSENVVTIFQWVGLTSAVLGAASASIPVCARYSSRIRIILKERPRAAAQIELAAALSTVLAVASFVGLWVYTSRIEDQNNARIEDLARQNRKLDAQQRPRAITPEQRGKLITLMHDQPKTGPVQVLWPGLDSEASAYAKEIRDVLTNCNFEVDFSRGTLGFGEAGTPYGVLLVVRDTRDAPALAGIIFNSFNAVGLTTIPATNPGFQTNQIQIFVGTKPEPH